MREETEVMSELVKTTMVAIMGKIQIQIIMYHAMEEKSAMEGSCKMQRVKRRSSNLTEVHTAPITKHKITTAPTGASKLVDNKARVRVKAKDNNIITLDITTETRV